MRLARHLCLAALLALSAPVPLAAQTTTLSANAEDTSTEAALLIADEVFIQDGSQLVASGNVEALHDGLRLTAARILFDQDSGLLTIEGPIRITDEAGNLLLADAAEMEEGLRNGLLKGARMVMDDQLQLAAVEAQRVDGRYTQLSRVAVTSCQVCGRNATPLWQIRAQRVIHDEEQRQLYFEGAQFRVLDVPILWVPHMRLPDPTLKRARGFLTPSIRSTSLLGSGLRIPYFIPLGDHQDITLTPYLSSETRTLEARYRRAFANGTIELNGAVSKDTLMPDHTRGYLFAEGQFGLRDGFQLDFDVATVSDDAYFNEYDYGPSERLKSGLTLSRARKDDYLQADLLYYETLRASEENDTQPSAMINTMYERRFFPTRTGGELRLGAMLHAHYRRSDLDIDSADDDSVVDGRDMARLSAEASWQRRWTLAGGIRAGVSGHLWADRYAVRDDAASDSEASQLTPGAALELRWPLIRRGAYGERTLLEPVLQYGWVGGERPNIPNDESTRVEFDEANLLSLSRFPAADRHERGRLMAAGLRWLHEAPSGWTAGLTLGRVWRDEPDSDFSRSSGLDSEASDWLIAGGFTNPLGLSISARGLLDDTAQFNKAEARAGWSNARMDLGATYVMLVQDPAEDRDESQAEWGFDGTYRITRHWTGSAEWRYDLADQRLDRTGVGLQYRNECVQVDFSVMRKFASSTNLEPSTDFGLTVALTGFGTTGSAKEYRRTCN
ncbi:LPS assembly protein LptD [Salipiger sp. P9]|uniref:LPS-assembly protein LptD n=1 Tax=Salipiger pentaromativorans TaxID=2943193 RepID=UPI0021577C74|nr:LPS assembly protein LptD [Salipiger pentaromativorans]MCR8550230.1 LPS assembly protein LptD [Salipiger pentaromativorans]